jgi:hypothetical protein
LAHATSSIRSHASTNASSSTHARAASGAREWIEAHAAEHPALAAVLEDGALQQQAGKVTMLWRRANEQRVVQLRRTEGIRTQARALSCRKACVPACSAVCAPLTFVAAHPSSRWRADERLARAPHAHGHHARLHAQA